VRRRSRWPLRTLFSSGPVQGGQNASDDICSCDLGPGARSHFRRFAGNPDRPASGRSYERCRCGERHAGALVRLALPSITSLASLVLPASSALKSMCEHRTCSRARPSKAARTSAGGLAMFTAMRRASSRVSKFAADRRTVRRQRPSRNLVSIALRV
jgi:hypothetical protein